MRTLCWLLLVVIVSLTVISSSCGNNPEETGATISNTDIPQAGKIEDALVQVWGKTGGEDTLWSFGVAVGDGTEILTVFDLIDNIPDSLEVGLPGKPRYPASIMAIDPRYNTVLLKMESNRLSVAVMGDTNAVQPGNEVTLHGWVRPEYTDLKVNKAHFMGYGTVFFVAGNTSPYVDVGGAPITDDKGQLIGMVGILSNTFVIILGGPGMEGPVINIKQAAELLAPDAVNQPWAAGPAFTLITNQSTLTGDKPSHPPLAKYEEMTAALKTLLGTAGIPLEPGEIPADYRSIVWGGLDTVDGTTFTALYPRLVELKNEENQVVAEAKWVGIQWGRSEGKPNRILYGHISQGRAITDGGFVLEGDINPLEKTLQP
jgi:hypothetical protein